MGGMLALAFTQLYPEMTERAIVMASAHANHAQAIAWNKIGRRAIMNDPLWRDGNYYDSPQGPPKHGLAVARMIGHVTYISEGAMDRKFGRALQSAEKESFTFGVDYSVESYLAYQGSIFHQRFDANSYLYITRAIDYFDFAAQDRRRSHRRLRRRPARGSASSPTTPTGSTRPSATKRWPSPPTPPAATPSTTKSTPPSATTPSSSRRSRRPN